MPFAVYWTSLVSIHAPAKEATGNTARPNATWRVSIHAPAKEATSSDPLTGISTQAFQSTPPRRRRPGRLVWLCGARVSIHAPAKEATAAADSAAGMEGFNPRPREGGDQYLF